MTHETMSHNFNHLNFIFDGRAFIIIIIIIIFIILWISTRFTKIIFTIMAHNF